MDEKFLNQILQILSDDDSSDGEKNEHLIPSQGLLECQN